MKDEIVIRTTRQNAGRILSGLRERNRKLLKGKARFGDDFDPVLGRNILAGLADYKSLIAQIEGLLE